MDLHILRVPLSNQVILIIQEKKEKNRTNLLNNQYQRSPPLRGGKEDC